MAARPVIYVDGSLLPAEAPHLSALDRGFTLGDGLFETMRLVGGRVFRLNDHLARLRRSAGLIGLLVPLDDSALEQAIGDAADANGLREAVVRLTLSRGVPTQRGLLPPSHPTPTLVIHAMPFTAYPPERYADGLSAHRSRIRRNETSPTASTKSCSYLDNVLARLEAAAAGADEAIMLNMAGQVAGGASSNVFVANGGVLATPPPESGALMGITRGVVRELALGLGLEWQERPLGAGDLARAEESFLTNAVMGIMPLTRLDSSPVGTGRPGPTTLALLRAYRDLIDRFRGSQPAAR